LLKYLSLLLAIQSDINSFHPEEPTRLRLDCQASIDPYQDAGDGLLDRLPNFPVHPAAEFLRHPLEMLFELGRSELYHGWLLDAL
jgi:hypothetical protein